MHKTRLFVIIVTSIMLVMVFGACFTASADGFGLIKVKATFMGIIPITNAEVWGEGEDERYDSYYAVGIYIILVLSEKNFYRILYQVPKVKMLM